LKDNTILILGGGALAVVAVGGYLVYKAAEKAAQTTKAAADGAAKTVNDTLAIPGNVVKTAAATAGSAATNTGSLITGAGTVFNANEGILEHGATEGGRELSGQLYNSYSAGVFGDHVGNVSVVAQKTGDACADPNFQLFCLVGRPVFDASEGKGYPRWHCTTAPAVTPAMRIGR
jgi:hypothetical protein